MEKRGKGPLPTEVGRLQQQVQAWRLAKKSGEHTPRKFWDAAVQLALQFGVCRIGRAVGLDYTSLRHQVAKTKEQLLCAGPTFVEIPAALMLPTAPTLETDNGPDPRWPLGSGPVIDLSTPDGARMRICLEPGKGGDAALLLTAFLRRGH